MFDPSRRSPDDVLAEVRGHVAASPLPALVVRLPGKRILAASAAAVGMLTGEPTPAPGQADPRPLPSIVGCELESFMADAPSAAAEMLLAGRLHGFDAQRVLRSGDRDLAATIRVRRVEGLPDVIVAVLCVDAASRDASGPRPPELPARRSTVGSADANLVIDRMSGDIEALIGESPSDVVGRPLLALVEVADVAALLRVVAQTSASEKSIRVSARLRGRCTVSPPGQLVVLPRNPVASCTFMFAPGRLSPKTGEPPLDGRELLSGPGPALAGPGPASAADVPAPATGIRTRPATGPSTGDGRQRELLGRLTSRETEIIARLVRGDRVPVIARELFLAQSTVRNHLSAAYAKLGVSSQQAVIDLFRDLADYRGDDRDKPSRRW